MQEEKPENKIKKFFDSFLDFKNKDESIIQNKKNGMIYVADFTNGKGKYISITEDYIEQDVNIRYSPKIELRLSYIINKDQIEGIKITKINTGNQNTESITLNSINIQEIISILSSLANIDLNSIVNKKLLLKEGILYDDTEVEKILNTISTDPKGVEKLKAFAMRINLLNIEDITNFIKTKDNEEKINEISKLVSDSGVSIDEIIRGLKNSKKEVLKQFREMLEDTTKNEDDWEVFFKTNKWILGLNIDIRFIRDFYKQANVGIQDTESKGSPHVDMLGINDYTSLVELKTPFTKIFTDTKKKTARTNTWSFTDSFIDGISQCLAQKSEADKRLESKDIVSPDNQTIDQNKIRTRDIKSVFIIGNKSLEISESSNDKDIQVKRDTFELFRRNNRNIEIITYDELYEKTEKIIELN